MDFAREGIVDQGSHVALVARDSRSQGPSAAQCRLMKALNTLSMRELRNLFMDSCRGAIAVCTEQRVQGGLLPQHISMLTSIKSRANLKSVKPSPRHYSQLDLLAPTKCKPKAFGSKLTPRTLLSTAVQEGQRKQSDQLLELKE